MTVQGRPRDAMAERYAELLAAGEGGVYVAFNLPNIQGAQRVADTLGLQPQRSSSGPWRFLGFAGSSPAAAVFFSAGGAPAIDADSLVTHRPPVSGLAEAWLEGGPELKVLLLKLGARRCGPATFAGLSGERFALHRGAVVIVPQRRGVRPRVLGVVVRSESAAGVIHPHASFWVRYEPQGFRTTTSGAGVGASIGARRRAQAHELGKSLHRLIRSPCRARHQEDAIAAGLRAAGVEHSQRTIG